MKELSPDTGKGIPLKTRVAVWFIFLTAFSWFAFLLCDGALDGFSWGDSGPLGFFFFLLVYIGPYFLAAYLLTLKSKRAYIAALLMLILYLFFVNWQVAVTSEVHHYSIISSVLVLVPISLIMLDIKNYWKIAR